MSTPTNTLAGLYRACGTLGNIGQPGAPIMHYSLLVDPKGTVTGMVEITQAIPVNGDIRIPVTGSIHTIVWGADVRKVILLSGEFWFYFTPPAIGQVREKFTCHMNVDETWKGKGGFEYGRNRIENVDVHPNVC